MLESGSKSSKTNSGNKSASSKWSPKDIETAPTDAYGVIEFHDAGKRTTAEVLFFFHM